MALLQLIYVSTLAAGTSEAEIVQILETSVRRNTAVGITGMLLFAQGNFMQVLEGERGAVEETYARIVRDPRHDWVLEIDRWEVELRDFLRWSMGYRHLSADELARVPSAELFLHVRDPLVIRARPGLALDLLRDFAANNL